MLDRLYKISKNPSMLIDGDEELSKLFMDMTISFFKATKQNEFVENSGGEFKDLLYQKELGRWATWEQIRLQNEALIEAASKVNFDVAAQEEEEEKHEENEAMEEEENAEVAPYNEEEEELMEEEKEEKPFEEMGNVEEEEEEGELNDDEMVNDKISRIIMGEDDVEDDNHMTYKDFFGDEPPEDNANDREKKIKEIENGLISKRSWELNGETVADQRPVDSLADVELDFDFTSSKPPEPMPTAELEELLIARIESMNFDDVVRKQKPKMTANEALQINSEKPKLGLVDEYVNDYIKKAEKDNDTGEKQLTQEEKEAIELYNSLEHELNRFTERRYIAKRPRESIDVTKGISLDVEEKPKSSLGPEEIMAPVGSTRQMKGENEVTSEEHKAKRRIRKEKYQKNQVSKDAAKGILYSQNGGDGSEVKIRQDMQKLINGNLQGVEVVAPGGAISDTKQKAKNATNKYLV